MRVLLITDHHSPAGGAEKYFFELKNRLKQLPELAVFSIGFCESENKGDDYHTFLAAKSNLAKLLNRFYINPFLLRKLEKSIKMFNPDVIHLHNVKQYTATVFAAIKKYPIVQTIHDFSLICPTAQNIHRDHSPCRTGFSTACFWQHKLKTFSSHVYFCYYLAFLNLRRQTKKNIKHYLSPSPLLAEYLQNHDFTPATNVLPFLTENKINIKNIPHANYFLFAGNLGSHKGVDYLLGEFALASKKNDEIKLFIAGTGPEENNMKKQAVKLGIQDKIQFLGWQTDLSSLYQQCGGLIFPSIGMESFGLVLIEAMQHGRPILAINRGTAAWLVKDNENGMLFEPNKTGDLAEKILFLANNPLLAEQWGVNGTNKLKTIINNQLSLEKIIQIYRQVVESDRERLMALT